MSPARTHPRPAAELVSPGEALARLQLTGRSLGWSRIDQSPLLTSEKKIRSLNGMTDHAPGALGM